MTIQLLIDGIIAALDAEFPDTDVYQEQVKQGLDEPCFLVRNISASNEPVVGSRYRRMGLFSVQYMAESETGAKAECYAVCDKLYQILEYISCGGDLVRGTGMSGETLDGVLTFTVSYNVFVWAEPEYDPMETLEINNYAR
jgi:hypothetical protein